MLSHQDAKQLLSRSGFGAKHSEIVDVASKSWRQAVDDIVDAEPSPLQPDPDLSDSRGWTERYVEMTQYWFDRARQPQNQLSEKMVLFWHGTLCSSLAKANHKKMFDQNQQFRTLGLGGFQQLLSTVSHGPAMLNYLDNNRNYKGRPNENLARELMELFTVGVGNYSETDVTESARAWTGETFDKNDNYVFDATRHDSGTKTFLGKTGNFRAADIINELLHGRTQQAHDTFMATKLWSFFAYPNPSSNIVQEIASHYRSSGLNIRETVRAIFMHPEFRSPAARDGLVQAPIDFVISALRRTTLDFIDVNPVWALRGMGQQPFYPPNVSGWKPNDAWLTESAIWARASYLRGFSWKLVQQEALPQLTEVVSYNPKTYAITTAEAVRQVHARLDIKDMSSAATETLQRFADSERVNNAAWAQEAGLYYLSLQAPEMWVS